MNGTEYDTMFGPVFKRTSDSKHKYTFKCITCAVTWHSDSTSSKCWMCGGKFKIKEGWINESNRTNSQNPD